MKLERLRRLVLGRADLCKQLGEHICSNSKRCYILLLVLKCFQVLVQVNCYKAFKGLGHTVNPLADFMPLKNLTSCNWVVANKFGVKL